MMNEFVQDLKNAVRTVSSKYVRYETIGGLQKGSRIEDEGFFKNGLDQNSSDPSLLKFLNQQKETYENSLEAVFCYELYHCWKQLMLSQKGRYSPLLLNGEIGKINLLKVIENFEPFKRTPLFDEINRLGMFSQGNFYPDFVLHGGNNNVEHQELIAEVKIKDKLNSDSFKRDFYRLAVYQKLYGFKTTCFIIVNQKLKELLSMLEAVNIELVDKTVFYFILKTSEETYCFKLDDIK